MQQRPHVYLQLQAGVLLKHPLLVQKYNYANRPIITVNSNDLHFEKCGKYSCYTMLCDILACHQTIV